MKVAVIVVGVVVTVVLRLPVSLLSVVVFRAPARVTAFDASDSIDVASSDGMFDLAVKV